MRHLLALSLALGLAATACKKGDDNGARTNRPPPMPAAELKRGTDACEDYVKRVCTCAETVATAKEPCTLAKALPEALELGKRLATNPSATDDDARQGADSIRKTIKNCIEQTAKLPALGCP